VTRVLSGVVLLLAVASAAWWGPPLLLLAIAVGVALLATFEYASIAGHLRAPIDRGAAAVAAVAVCTAVAWPGLGAAEPVVMASVLAMAILAVGRGQTSADSLARVAASVFGPLYIGLPLGALVAVHWMYGREAALLLILVVIVSDTAQYYAGRLLGRRPLAPALSPKKTVEGALGGLFFGALALAILGHWWWPQAPVALRAVLGATVVVLGITGDLFESLLKRAAGLKDSSGLIPGHGGVLDRIDALLFAAPVYYIVMRTLAGAA
jgi:phosphatidate cytidylyltransferase